MNPEQKSKWMSALDSKIEIRQKNIDQTRTARNSADSPMTSRYDTQRDIFNNDLNILLDSQESDARLRSEIEQAGECQIVESGAFLELSIDGDTENFLFMNNYGSLPDVHIITPNSPIGQAIIGKRMEESTVYTINNNTVRVDIKKIE